MSALVDTNVLVYWVELLSEDFPHGRLYGTVRAVNPFGAMS